MERREPGRIKKLAGLLLALAFTACATHSSSPAQRYDLSKDRIVSHGGISTYNGKPLNGMVFLCNEKGDTLQLIPFENGKENGIAKTFYENGKQKERRVFVHGKKEGEHLGWYENGQLQYRYHYSNDVYDGAVEEWYADGKPYQRLSFKEGHEDGAQQYWYENGEIKSNYVIKNGRRYGLLGTRNCVNVSDSIGI